VKALWLGWRSFMFQTTSSAAAAPAFAEASMRPNPMQPSDRSVPFDTARQTGRQAGGKKKKKKILPVSPSGDQKRPAPLSRAEVFVADLKVLPACMLGCSPLRAAAHGQIQRGKGSQNPEN
jgi:hypothetical protein